VIVGVAGKGGVGKSTIAALLIRSLLARGVKPLLVVDADPNSCLYEKLGVEAGRTLGQIREESTRLKHEVSTLAKRDVLEMEVQSAVVEGTGFDLLAMGRQEGPGCYCYVNNLLRESLDSLAGNYPWVVIDCEAGMEHLSRRTAKDVDYLFVVCNGSYGSVDTAVKILDLIQELRTEARHRVLVLNNLGEDADRVAASLLERIDTNRFGTYGVVLHDPELEACERRQQSLLALPDDTPAFLALERILEDVPG
jgi:CO dehydrogenase maturation factor